MSRIAKKPLKVPAGVTVLKNGDSLSVKGKKGGFTHVIPKALEVNIDNDIINVCLKDGYDNNAILGTTVVLLGNMITGVHNGFQKKLQLIGVGYRAKAQGNNLELSLGFSHPVIYSVAEGLTIETPTNTEIIISGIDKEKVGQAAAEIRDFRPPESYKGKGVRYADEQVIIKETKKK